MNKDLQIIIPNEMGHEELPLKGNEDLAVKLVKVSMNTILQRERLLSRRKERGRTGTFLNYELREDESFQEAVRNLLKENKFFRRTIDRGSYKGKRLESVNVVQTHIAELKAFELLLDGKPLGKCNYFTGRGYYPPWIELDYDPWPRQLGLEAELFKFFFDILPDNGRFFITYYKDPRTFNAIIRGSRWPTPSWEDRC